MPPIQSNVLISLEVQKHLESENEQSLYAYCNYDMSDEYVRKYTYKQEQIQKQKEDRQGALAAPAASAAPVSVFANVPTIADLITNARKLVSESYVDTNNKSRLINKSLDILRGIDKSNLEGNLIGEYSMLIDTINIT